MAGVGDDVDLVLTGSATQLLEPGRVLTAPPHQPVCRKFEAVVHVPEGEDPEGVGSSVDFRHMRAEAVVIATGAGPLPQVRRFEVEMDELLPVEVGDRFEIEGGFAGVVTSVAG